MSKFQFNIIFISILIGLLSGTCSSFFLHSLNWITNLRIEHSYLIWFLPVFGLVFGILIKSIPHHINQGVPYILQELDNHEAHVSPWMAPFIFLSSLGTHLFGGSAGREGVGVIMGASVAHLLPLVKKSYQEYRPYLIYSGISAGFSSIFGTPITAIIFSLELYRFKDVKKEFLLIATTMSSLVALLMSRFIGPVHQHFYVDFQIDRNIGFYILISSICAGVGGHFFYWSLKGYTKFISKLVTKIEWKLTVGALFISLVVFFTNGYEFVGIGTDFISKSFTQEMFAYDFLMKCLLTVMTLAIGFKGGEVTPLFFMGATLSNSVSSFFNLNNYALSSSLGMVGLFGAVTATPLASIIMATELFGWKVGIISIFVCFIARVIMWRKSVYRH